MVLLPCHVEHSATDRRFWSLGWIVLISWASLGVAAPAWSSSQVSLAPFSDRVEGASPVAAEPAALEVSLAFQGAASKPTSAAVKPQRATDTRPIPALAGTSLSPVALPPETADQAQQSGAALLPLVADASTDRAEDDLETDSGSSLERDLESNPETDSEANLETDDELGPFLVRERPLGADPELGVIRVREVDELPPAPPPAAPQVLFLTGRAGAFGGTNLFRSVSPIADQVFQAGVGLYLFPQLGPNTTLLAGIEGNLVRYGSLGEVNYNELQLQVGLRQRLSQRTYGQIGWRAQRLYVPGGKDFFNADYVEVLLSRRDILTRNAWLDSYYQARLSFSHPQSFSRFSQTLTGSLNYGFTPKLRTSLVYQLFLDDYTAISRYDAYHQLLVQVSYDTSATSRLSVFGGYRFGRSSIAAVSFDDVVYGISFSFSEPLF